MRRDDDQAALILTGSRNQRAPMAPTKNGLSSSQLLWGTPSVEAPKNYLTKSETGV
jgi:hypothetical protein